MAAGDITAQLQTASKHNSAVFDGADDYVEIAHHAAHLGANLSNGFTISAYILPRSLGETNGRILDKSNGVSGELGFEFDIFATTNKLRFRINNGSSAYSSNNSVVYGTWQYVTVTVTAAQLCNFYINGVLNGTANQDLVQTIAAMTTTNVMRVGNRSGGTDRTFDGSISHLKMWNRVLTTDEILCLYNGINCAEGEILHLDFDTDYTDKSPLNLSVTNSGTYLSNTMVNKITADMDFNLATATDKIIALPVSGRDQTIRIVKAERAA